MKSTPEKEFTADKYNKAKTYGSYVTRENDTLNTFVVGPFDSQADASMWLTKKHAANPAKVLDDHFVLNADDMYAIFERNKASSNKPKM